VKDITQELLAGHTFQRRPQMSAFGPGGHRFLRRICRRL